MSTKLYALDDERLARSIGALPHSAPGVWPEMDSSGPRPRLTGKMLDADTGLYYFHARWYDPAVGRFVGRDKANQRGSDTCGTCCKAKPGRKLSQELDDYTLVGNSPTLLVDVSGNQSNYFQCMEWCETAINDDGRISMFESTCLNDCTVACQNELELGNDWGPDNAADEIGSCFDRHQETEETVDVLEGAGAGCTKPGLLWVGLQALNVIRLLCSRL